MDIEISSFTPSGNVDIPTSKSYAHRYLISAFISNKGAVIKNVNLCEDVICSLNALKQIGANYLINGDTVEFFANSPCLDSVSIDVGSSASTLRFLFPLVVYLCGNVTFKGSKELFMRPLDPYLELLNEQHIPFKLNDDSIEIYKKLEVQDFVVNGNVSSQFISGYLFLLAYVNETHFIKINKPFESKSYVDMTLDVLKKFGVKFLVKDNLIINNFSNFNYLSTVIEKDFSQLAFFSLLGSVKGNISFSNLNLNSLQGDKQIIDILIDCGAKIDFFGDNVTFFHSILKGTSIDISNCIDLGPILFVLGAVSYGTTRLVNTKRLSYKESNRLLSMKEELSKADVDITILDDEVVIKGKAYYKGDYVFSSHNDHRVCMALSIFSVINEGKSLILNCECVNKSYPNFFRDLLSLRKEVL